MLCRIYRARVVIDVACVDEDMCPATETRIVFDDLFTSDEGAIAAARMEYDKRPVNEYVVGVWAYVVPVIVDSRGSSNGERIFNEYKVYKEGE